jgi:NADH:ubiquinone oxidoreductase subunit H
MFIIFFVINFLLLLIPLLISVAFLTLLERKVMSTIQRRVGPNVVGVFGLLQPFADGFKIVFKDTIFPRNILILPFVIGPMFLFTFSFIAIGFIPVNYGVSLFYHPFSMIFILVFLGFAIYGIVAAG